MLWNVRVPAPERKAQVVVRDVGISRLHACGSCGGFVHPTVERYCKHCGARLVMAHGRRAV